MQLAFLKVECSKGKSKSVMEAGDGSSLKVGGLKKVEEL